MFYAGTEILATLTQVLLLALGFRLGTDPRGGMLVAAAGVRLPYTTERRRVIGMWTVGNGGGGGEGNARTGSGVTGHDGWPSPYRTSPVVVLHGVGLGLLPYINMLRCVWPTVKWQNHNACRSPYSSPLPSSFIWPFANPIFIYLLDYLLH